MLGRSTRSFAASTRIRTTCSEPTRPRAASCVRALRPGASAVSAILTADKVRRARADPCRGALRGDASRVRRCRSRYQLRAEYGPAGAIVIDDPYLLHADARRARPAPDQRGAPRAGSTSASARASSSIEGVHGTAFAVWAPSARAVSVVGDFNFWDGRVHQMRSLGAERHLGAVRPRDRRRAALQVRDPRRRRLPAAEGRPATRQEAEHPPRTASVVNERPHHWAASDEALA